tara:strand:- start:13353 stop:13925 length:573 start_codon:yes stop_codon:yes gene_type:complete
MSNKNIKNNLIKLAMDELIKGNWANIDINFMSKKLKASPEIILSICTSKNDLLDMWSDNINQEMLSNICHKELKKVSIKERLLEIMLCRFDALSAKLKEVNALVNLSKSNLIESKKSLIRIYNSMELICNCACVSTKGSKGFLKVKALSIIWLLVFREWYKTGMKNEDILLSQLDKNLVLAEKLKNIIFK